MTVEEKQEALDYSWSVLGSKGTEDLEAIVQTCPHPQIFTHQLSIPMFGVLFIFLFTSGLTYISYVITCIEEQSSLCCVLQSILPAGYSPPTGCNEPAWAASVINIMGRQSSEKQTHCGALASIWRVHPQHAGGKKRVESSQISNWSQNVDCAGLRAL